MKLNVELIELSLEYIFMLTNSFILSSISILKPVAFEFQKFVIQTVILSEQNIFENSTFHAHQCDSNRVLFSWQWKNELIA